MIEINVEQSVVINLTPEEIFEYLSDPGNTMEWASGMIAIRKVSPGELRAGTLLKTTVRFLGKWLDITFEIIECEPNRCLTLKSTNGTLPCLGCYRFEQEGHGRTVVFQDAMMQFVEGVIELTGPVIVSAARRLLEYDLLTLKEILEARAPMCEIA